jgi:Uma2 family endonuclease
MTTTLPGSTISTSQPELDDLVAELLPLQGQWSPEDYLWLTDHSNRLVEFTEGHVEVLPMPTDEHQSISRHLFVAFLAFLTPRGGLVQYAPLRVQVRPRLYREPDLVVLRDARDPRRQNRYWLGADLVLEIVSPDQPARDLVEKRADYAGARIPEYWIVDPRNQTIAVLRLKGDEYVEHGVFGRGLRATSALLAEFAVDVEAVFAAD